MEDPGRLQLKPKGRRPYFLRILPLINYWRLLRLWRAKYQWFMMNMTHWFAFSMRRAC